MRTWIVAAGVGAIVAVGVVAAFIVVNNIRQAQACTYGFYGMDMQVTAEGGHASDFCQGLGDQHGCQLGPSGPGWKDFCNDPPPAPPPSQTMGNVGGYRVDHPDPEGTVMCAFTVLHGTAAEHVYGQVTITVRDKGLLKVNGTNYCQQLDTWVSNGLRNR